VKRYQHGVTLLELMAVVVIIGILASIAVPTYRGYVMRAQRSEGTTMLLRAAAAQEKYYLQNNGYTDVVAGTGATSLKLFSTGNTTERGLYTLGIAAGSTGTLASSYTITVTAAGGQLKDTTCQTFTITETGQRGAKNSSNADTTNACWR
jgi:type IV pilus assembly protein PilE